MKSPVTARKSEMLQIGIAGEYLVCADLIEWFHNL